MVPALKSTVRRLLPFLSMAMVAIASGCLTTNSSTKVIGQSLTSWLLPNSYSGVLYLTFQNKYGTTITASGVYLEGGLIVTSGAVASGIASNLAIQSGGRNALTVPNTNYFITDHHPEFVPDASTLLDSEVAHDIGTIIITHPEIWRKDINIKPIPIAASGIQLGKLVTIVGHGRTANGPEGVRRYGNNRVWFMGPNNILNIGRYNVSKDNDRGTHMRCLDLLCFTIEGLQGGSALAARGADEGGAALNEHGQLVGIIGPSGRNYTMLVNIHNILTGSYLSHQLSTVHTKFTPRGYIDNQPIEFDPDIDSSTTSSRVSSAIFDDATGSLVYDIDDVSNPGSDSDSEPATPKSAVSDGDSPDASGDAASSSDQHDAGSSSKDSRDGAKGR